MDLKGFGGQILTGAGLTLLVAALSLVFGLMIGGLGAAAKLSKSKRLRAAAEAYTTLVRGVPELLILLLLYFGGTVLLTWIAGEYVEVDGFGAGLFALSILCGAYTTEVLRAAIAGVPKGQAEAARALGLDRVQMVRLVLLPQVWRLALPGLGNVWLVLLKDTSLISVVGLEELMRKSAIAAGATREPFTFYAVAAGVYLLFTTISVLGIAALERRARRGLARV
ncbi:nopaline transport system permease protein NocQ [Aliidongia dinghuensis]|uniref:Nopaline transport system permease protein NocQ n=1 Tax=Aliidongia dinghuensis TaxID=1867774 RepID=A0A8J2YWT1_9PROT|nr:ABC transporter permease subunit [Aliidongia dinghuensis]GGF33373.1 nopaline transport system permease protein NocQ [Aliidongia dinghuensis]